jgi:hypothetical protein
MRLHGIALAALASMAVAALDGCSGGNSTGRSADQATAPGQIDLQLRLPDGSSIDSVGYEITHTNGYDNDGSVDVSNSTLVRFQVGNIPAATGYNIRLSATTSAGVACTSEPRSFDVLAGQTTGITVTLRCGTGGTVVVGSDAGNVRVSVDVVSATPVTCPAQDGLTALPIEVTVGSSVSLTGYSTLAGSTFSWSSAPAATFSAPSAPSTTFTCPAVGDYVITMTVAGATACPPSSDTVTVTCSPAPGIDASVPDAAVPDTSVPDAEVPDAAVPDAEVPDAAVPDAEVPDAAVPDAEIPDAAVPDAEIPDATVPDAEIPDATVPDAEIPDAAVPDADVPDTSVPDASGPTCATCQEANCRSYLGVDLIQGCFVAVDPNNEFGADPADPLFIQQCVDTVDCARVNGCGFTAAFQAIECYCGSNSFDCLNLAPAADAKCTPQWRAATRGATHSAVMENFSNPALPSGWAYFMLDCYRLSCNSTATGNCTVAGP